MYSDLKIESYDSGSKIYDKTYGEWTVKWWQWALGTPASSNPVIDETGRNWNNNQPAPNVWFLAGNFGDVSNNFPHRSVKMPAGRSLLLPVLNCEANSLEYPELKTHGDLIEHVTRDLNSVVKKVCMINGMSLTPERVMADPPIFSVTLDDDNVLGVEGKVTVDAAG